MAWIRVIPPEQADGELAEYYRESREWSRRRRALWGLLAGDGPEESARDWTANPDGNISSLNPAAALAHLRLGDVILYSEGPLSQVQRQMIATVVSARNRCTFCTLRHGRFSRELAGDATLTAHLIHDPHAAAISEADKAMLDFADKLTVQPDAATQADIEGLRAHGFSDRAILDIVLIVGLFNLTNRVVLGLGRDLHEGMDEEISRFGIGAWRESP